MKFEKNSNYYRQNKNKKDHKCIENFNRIRTALYFKRKCILSNKDEGSNF